MSDRELLELVAKAAGIECDGFDEDLGRDVWWLPDLSRYGPWGPLDDDGDALRLVAKLKLSVCYHHEDDNPAVTVMVPVGWHERFFECHEPISDDCSAATRRAIVRAAAEIGRAMP